ncbi:MAG TPA: serine protease [Gammaproteobacteria bacterium]|nr:serine protease [Gammaproteobacteria bacterium]
MEQLFKKFAPLCAMVMKQNGDSVDFLGTAFAVREDGYLATAAHVVKDQEKLLISPATDATGYQATSQKLRCLAVSVVQMDEPHDVALLKLAEAISLKLPPDLLGDADTLAPGASIAHLGYPFGKTGVLALALRSGVLAAKTESAQGIQQLYLEGSAYSGAAGGPVLDTRHSRVIGIITRQISLVPVAQASGSDFRLPVMTDMTYASPINVLVKLLTDTR